MNELGGCRRKWKCSCLMFQSEQSKRYARSITPDHSKRHDAMNGLGDSTRSANPITRHDAISERAQNDSNTNTDRDPRFQRPGCRTTARPARHVDQPVDDMASALMIAYECECR